MSGAPVLSVRGLTKRFPGQTEAGAALKNLSFHINAGEIYGLLGPNGAGKTTAISICCGQAPPCAGEVLFLEKDMLKQGRAKRRLRGRIGLAPQETALYERLSGRENLIFFGRMYGLQGEQLTRRVDEAIRTVGLEGKMEDLLTTYSGGMLRRLNLAVALLNKPLLLFLDEPTVGVDPQSRARILESIKSIGEQGAAVLYTTHYMEEAQHMCTRVGVMDNGAIVAEGTPSELLKKIPAAADLGEVFLHFTGKDLRD